MARKRTKTLKQAFDQLNRIQAYYERTGRASTAQRIRRRTIDVGGTIGNMADRIVMMGGDYTDYRDNRVPLTFEERTKPTTQAEFDAAVKRNQGKPTQRILNARAKAQRDLERSAARADKREKQTHRAARKAQGLSVG